MKHNPKFLKLVRSSKGRVREILVSKVKDKLKRGGPLFLIDIREDHEFERGHAKGAVHLGRGILERDIETLIPDPSAEIVLYCGGGFRSALAADSLRKMGYRNALSMAGGFKAWVRLKYPVVRGPRSGKPIKRKIKN